MTSNVGSQFISEATGDLDRVLPRVLEELRGTFRPEFLNRIDDVIVFRRLTLDLIDGIVRLQIRSLAKLLEQSDLKLTVSDGAIRALAQEGYDPVYGARPIKRLIQKKIQDRLALMMLNGEVRAGDTVDIGTDQAGQMVFNRSSSAAA
jgi:ATP-dependent Clp protease ATP-binding subunit ClpB